MSALTSPAPHAPDRPTPAVILRQEIQLAAHRILVFQGGARCFAVEVHARQEGRWSMVRGAFGLSTEELANETMATFVRTYGGDPGFSSAAGRRHRLP